MDCELIYRKQLERLIDLAKQPAWKAWAWHYAKELAACDSGLFAGIDSDLAKAMQDMKK